MILSLLMMTGAPMAGAQEAISVGKAEDVPQGGLSYAPTASDISPVMGSYSPSVELQLPGAARDLVPNINLVYGQGRANGYLGAGWSLAFESRIEARSPHGGAAVNYLSSDITYYLDGERLYELADGTYRTEQDDYSVYEKVMLSGKIITWRAKKNGFTRTWGEPTGTSGFSNAILFHDEILLGPVASGGQSKAWLLSQEEDASGNQIQYTYGHQSYAAGPGGLSASHWPASIRYNFHPTIAPGNDFTVSFTYEERDDIRRVVDGIPRYHAHRLSGISVENAAGTETHAYALSYDYALDGQSTLTAVHRESVLDSEIRLLREMDYQDDTSTFATTSTALTFSDDVTEDPSLETAQTRWESHPMLTDVDGDSRPDLIVLTQRCGATTGVDPTGNNGGGGGETNEMPLISAFQCTDVSHRVFINKVVDGNASHDFVYDSARSTALTGFLGALYEAGAGENLQFALIDINRDGYLDLLRGDQSTGQTVATSSLVYGAASGWDLSTAVQPSFLAEADILSAYQLVDINGDGYPDLVGQSEFELNDPDLNGDWHFKRNAGALQTLDDPVVDLGLSAEYNDQSNNAHSSASLTCMDDSSGPMVVLSTLGTYSNASGGTDYYPDPSSIIIDDQIRPEDWVWRHTQHMDVNADGHVDRVIHFPFLAEDTAGEYLDDGSCGYFSEVYLGDGLGGFEAADYGLGNPIHRESWSVDRPIGNHSVTYSGANHDTSLVDATASGRAELTATCDLGSGLSELQLLTHQGLDGVDPGFGFDSMGNCPSGGVSLPLDHLGFNPMTRSYQTLADINADGLVDAFTLGWDENAGQWQVAYYPQTRLEQNRLKAIETHLGAKESVTWSRSALDVENHIPLNVPVVSAMDEMGVTTYRYREASYVQGQFVGFGQVEINDARGVSTVESYHRYPYLKGKRYAQGIYDADGKLKTYTVDLYGPIVSNTMGADLTIPYVNPKLRTCVFEMGLHYTPVNLDALMEECDDFTDEVGGNGGWELTDLGRTVWATLRGKAPQKLTQNAVELDKLYDIQRALKGEANTNFTGQFTPAYTSGFSPVFMAPQAGAQQSDTLTGVIPSHATSYAQAAGLSGVSLGNRPGQGHHGLSPNYRLYVTEWDYDLGHGNVVETRQLRNVDTLEDSLITQNGYFLYDATFEGARLQSQLTSDRVGGHSTQWTFGNYVDDQWQLRTQTPTGSSTLSPRSESRTFDGRGLRLSATDFRGVTTLYTPDHCGQVEKLEDTYGNWTQTQRDALCLLTQETNNKGLNRQFTHNGFREVTTSQIDRASSQVALGETHYLKNYGANAFSPQMAVAYDDGVGDIIVKKTHVDTHGRAWYEESCVLDSASANASSTDIALRYPCVSGSVHRQFKLYYTTGELMAETAPYNDADISQGTLASTQYTYDEFARVKEITHGDGTVSQKHYGLGWTSTLSPSGITQLDYTTTLEKSQVVDGINRGSMRQNAFGLEIESVDAAGQSTTYDYDAYLRKIARHQGTMDVIDGALSIPFDATHLTPETLTTTYEYYVDDRLKTEIDPAGHRKSFGWDQIGRKKWVKDPNNIKVQEYIYIDGPQPKTRIKDEAGNFRTREFDADGHVVKETSAAGLITTHDYDGRGRKVEGVLPWGAQESLSYGVLGQVESRVHTEGSVIATTTYAHNGRGQVVSQIDADGAQMHTIYDGMGRVLNQKSGDPAGTYFDIYSAAYDLDGRLIQEVKAGAMTRLQYDSLGRLTRSEAGCVETSPGVFSCLTQMDYTHTDLDQVETVTDKAGIETHFTYNRLGLEESVEVFDEYGLSQGVAYTYYDQGGQARLKIDEEGILDQVDYDARGRVIQERNGANGDTTYTYNINPSNLRGGATGPALIAGSTRVRMTSPTGDVLDTHRNRDGEVYLTQHPDLSLDRVIFVNGLPKTQEKWMAVSGPTGLSLSIYNAKLIDYHPQSTRVHRDWDWMALGNLTTCKTNPACGFAFVAQTYTDGGRLQSVEDASGNQTTYGYAADGTMALASVSRDGLPDTALTYDGYGKLQTQVSDPLGSAPITQTLAYENHLWVDELDRSQVIGGVTTTESIDLILDHRGLVEDMVFARSGEPVVTILKTHDAKGRLLSRSHVVDGIDRGTLEFSYFDNGLPESVIYPSGNQVDYTYQALSRRLTSVLVQNGGVSQSVIDLSNYDDAGRARILEWVPSIPADAVVLTRSYLYGRELNRDIARNGSALRHEAFTYDGIGRLSGVESTQNLNPVMDTLYTYNHRNYLTNESHDDGVTLQSTTYTFDVGGRRDTKVVDDGSSIQNQSYAYSLDGNRLSDVTTDGVNAALTWTDFAQVAVDQAGRSFEYGLAGQLLSITDGSDIESMGYDGDGLRIWRDDGLTLSYYLSGAAPDALYAVVNATDGTYEDYIRLPSGAVVATVDALGTINPLVQNITGSPYWSVQTSDFTDRQAYGDLLSGESELDVEMGFHQMMGTQNSGVHIAGVRAYDADTGRFLSTDPLGFAAAADINDAADLFRYAHNNPIHIKDPTGYAGEPMEGGRSMGRGHMPKFYECIQNDQGGGCITGGYIKGQISKHVDMKAFSARYSVYRAVSDFKKRHNIRKHLTPEAYAFVIEALLQSGAAGGMSEEEVMGMLEEAGIIDGFVEVSAEHASILAAGGGGYASTSSEENAEAVGGDLVGESPLINALDEMIAGHDSSALRSALDGMAGSPLIGCTGDDCAAGGTYSGRGEGLGSGPSGNTSGGASTTTASDDAPSAFVDPGYVPKETPPWWSEKPGDGVLTDMERFKGISSTYLSGLGPLEQELYHRQGGAAFTLFVSGSAGTAGGLAIKYGPSLATKILPTFTSMAMRVAYLPQTVLSTGVSSPASTRLFIQASSARLGLTMGQTAAAVGATSALWLSGAAVGGYYIGYRLYGGAYDENATARANSWSNRLYQMTGNSVFYYMSDLNAGHGLTHPSEL